MPRGWTRLNLPTGESRPPLLIKFSTSSTGYEVYLTDLGNIWSETLSRRMIIRRALTDDTTIDPSEDAEQFQVLLQKVEDALYGSKGSKVTVNKAPRGHDLEITTSTKLPGPLQPLEWRFHLSKCPQDALTRHVVLPLLREERSRETQLRSLMEHLKEKDWVLGKLFDKIEAIGLDLGSVFPSAAGVRSGHTGMTFSQAAKSIKGVAAFDEDSWRLGLESKAQDQGSDKLSLQALDLDIERINAASDNWWEHLDAKNSTAKPGTSFSSTKSSYAPDQETSEGSDDEFQKQETPPRLKQTTRGRDQSSVHAEADETGDAQGNADHSETASDDEAPTRASTVSTKSSHQATARPKNLGTIGGKKKPKENQRSWKSTASTASSSESLPTPSTKPNADDSTESDEEGAHSPERQPPVEKTVKPHQEDKPKKQRAGGLGVIGGGKKSKDKQSSRDLTPLPDRSRDDASGEEKELRPQDSPKKPIRGGKLGLIGKKAKNQDDQRSKGLPSRTSKTATPVDTHNDESDDLDSQPVSKSKASKSAERTTNIQKDEPSSSSPEPPKKPPPEPRREETAEEKADRRREELKRQLEAKDKAPTKKKRKF